MITKKIDSYLSSLKPNLLREEKAITEELFTQLEEYFGPVNRESGSNIAILVTVFAKQLALHNEAVCQSMDSIRLFFSQLENGYLAYSNSSADGLRQKMLELEGLLDFKQQTFKERVDDHDSFYEVTKKVQTIIKIDPEQQTASFYEEIGKVFLSYMDVGTFSEAAGDDPQPLTVTAKAANGQAVSFSFSLAKEILLKMSFRITLEPKEMIPYDLNGRIKEALQIMIDEHYGGRVGHNFHVQDFYAACLGLNGIRRLSVRWENISTDEESLAFFPDGNDEDRLLPDRFYLSFDVAAERIFLEE